jgi:hypothetical protein
MAFITCSKCGQSASTTVKKCPACGNRFAATMPTPKSNSKRKLKSWRREGGVKAAIVFVVIAALICVGASFMESTIAKPPGDPVPLTGQTWYAKGAPIGCKDKADLQRLVDLSQQRDPAFRTLYVEKSLQGQCRSLSQDTLVVVDSDHELGRPCVKLKGEPSCLFVIGSQLKNSLGLRRQRGDIDGAGIHTGRPEQADQQR